MNCIDNFVLESVIAHLNYAVFDLSITVSRVRIYWLNILPK